MARGLFRTWVPVIAVVAGVALLWLSIRRGGNNDYQQKIDAYQQKVDSLQGQIDVIKVKGDSIAKVNETLKYQIHQKEISIISIQQKYDQIRNGLAHLSTDEHIQFFAEQVSQ